MHEKNDLMIYAEKNYSIMINQLFNDITFKYCQEHRTTTPDTRWDMESCLSVCVQWGDRANYRISSHRQKKLNFTSD